jgi:hypothetical protein
MIVLKRALKEHAVCVWTDCELNLFGIEYYGGSYEHVIKLRAAQKLRIC